MDWDDAYKSLMRNRRASPIQPCLLIGMSRGYERRRGNLLCIQPETHFAWVVLAVWNGAGDRLRDESIVLHQRIELLDAGRLNIRVAKAGLVLNIVSIYWDVNWMGEVLGMDHSGEC